MREGEEVVLANLDRNKVFLTLIDDDAPRDATPRGPGKEGDGVLLGLDGFTLALLHLGTPVSGAEARKSSMTPPAV